MTTFLVIILFLMIFVMLMLFLLELMGVDIKMRVYVSFLALAIGAWFGLLVNFIVDCTKGVCL